MRCGCWTAQGSPYPREGPASAPVAKELPEQRYCHIRGPAAQRGCRAYAIGEFSTGRATTPDPRNVGYHDGCESEQRRGPGVAPSLGCPAPSSRPASIQSVDRLVPHAWRVPAQPASGVRGSARGSPRGSRRDRAGRWARRSRGEGGVSTGVRVGTTPSRTRANPSRASARRPARRPLLRDLRPTWVSATHVSIPEPVTLRRAPSRGCTDPSVGTNEEPAGPHEAVCGRRSTQGPRDRDQRGSDALGQRRHPTRYAGARDGARRRLAVRRRSRSRTDLAVVGHIRRVRITCMHDIADSADATGKRGLSRPTSSSGRPGPPGRGRLSLVRPRAASWPGRPPRRR